MLKNSAAKSGNADRVGVVASSLCIGHCILTPVVLSLGPMWAHFLPGEEIVHRTMAVLVALAGLIAFVRGYRVHGRPAVGLLFASGVALIAFTAVWGDDLPSHLVEIIITLAGGLLMIGGHWLNHTFCKACCHQQQGGVASCRIVRP